MEGYKPLSVSDAVYDELMATVDKAKAQPIAQQKPQQPSGCSLVVVVSLPGPKVDRGCGGSCGFWDRFLGRSCKMVGSTEPGGLEIYCTCSGGWFDRIFG
jgi:hypothetical protein